MLSRLAGPTFALQYTLAQSVAGESPSLTRDLLGNASLGPLLRLFEDSLRDLMWASGDEPRFAALHSGIVESLSVDPSYAGASARRQRAARAALGDVT